MKWFDNLKINYKMLIIISIQIVFMMAITYVGYSRINILDSCIDDMYNGNLLPVKYSEAMRAENRAIEGVLYQLILVADLSDQQRQDLIKQIDIHTKEYDVLSQRFEKAGMVDVKEKDIYSRLQANSLQFRSETEKAVQLLESSSGDSFTYFVVHAKPLLDKVNADLEDLADYNTQEADEMNLQAVGITAAAQKSVLFMVLISLIISGLGGDSSYPGGFRSQ